MGKLPIPEDPPAPPTQPIAEILQELGPQFQSTPRKTNIAADPLPSSSGYGSVENTANSIDDIANLPDVDETLENPGMYYS